MMLLIGGLMFEYLYSFQKTNIVPHKEINPNISNTSSTKKASDDDSSLNQATTSVNTPEAIHSNVSFQKLIEQVNPCFLIILLFF